MEGRTYSIIRVHRDRDGEWEKIVESGLDWETAHAKAIELGVRERFANPTKTSWTRDLFYCQLEGSVRHGKLARKLRRQERQRPARPRTSKNPEAFRFLASFSQLGAC